MFTDNILTFDEIVFYFFFYHILKSFSTYNVKKTTIQTTKTVNNSCRSGNRDHPLPSFTVVRNEELIEKKLKIKYSFSF